MQTQTQQQTHEEENTQVLSAVMCSESDVVSFSAAVRNTAFSNIAEKVKISNCDSATASQVISLLWIALSKTGITQIKTSRHSEISAINSIGKHFLEYTEKGKENLFLSSFRKMIDKSVSISLPQLFSRCRLVHWACALPLGEEITPMVYDLIFISLGLLASHSRIGTETPEKESASSRSRNAAFASAIEKLAQNPPIAFSRLSALLSGSTKVDDSIKRNTYISSIAVVSSIIYGKQKIFVSESSNSATATATASTTTTSSSSKEKKPLFDKESLLPKFAEWLNTFIFSGTSPTQYFIASLYGKLLSSFSAKEAVILVESLSSFVKRCPQSGIFFVQKVISNLKPLPAGQIPLTSIESLCNFALTVVKSVALKQESTHIFANPCAYASLLISDVVKMSALDVAVASSAIKSVSNVLLGSDGPLSYAQQRVAILAIISEIGKLKIPLPQNIVEETLKKLVEFDQKETNPEVKKEWLMPFGIWCSALPSSADLADPQKLAVKQPAQSPQQKAPAKPQAAKGPAPKAPTFASFLIDNPSHTTEDLKSVGLEALRFALLGRNENFLHETILAPLLSVVSASTSLPIAPGDKLKNPRHAPTGLAHASSILTSLHIANQKLVDIKIMQAMLAPNSVLFDPIFVARLSKHEVESLLSLITTIFNVPQISKIVNKETMKIIHVTLISLVLHPNTEARRYSANVVANLNKSSNVLSSALIDAYSTLLKNIYEQKLGETSATASVTAPSAANEKGKAAPQPAQPAISQNSQLLVLCNNSSGYSFPAQLLLDGLRSIVTLPPFLPIENIPRVFLMCHYTIMNDSIQQRLRGDDVADVLPPAEKVLELGSKVWGCISRDLAGAGEGSLLLQKNVLPVAKYLMQTLCTAREQYLVNASLCGINTLFSECPIESLTPVASLVADQIVDTVTANFTPREILIAATPKGTLFNDDETKDQIASIISGSITNIERSQKKRGLGRLYSVQDEKWEAEVRKELEAKKQKTGATPEEKVIASQDEIRFSCELATRSVRHSLLALRAMRYGSKANCLAFFHHFIPKVIDLFPHTFLGNFAHETFSILGQTIPSGLVPPLVTQACASLTRIVVEERGKHKLMENDPLVFSAEMKVILMLATACGCAGNNAIVSSGDVNYGEIHTRTQPLPGQAFYYYFYVIRNAMEREYNTDTKHLHACAMKLLTVHTSPDIPIPRMEMAQVLIDVIEEKPRYARQACQALIPLLSGMSISDTVSVIPGLTHKNLEVRLATLEALKLAPAITFQPTVLNEKVQAILFVSLQDPDLQAKEIAEAVWNLYNHPIGVNYYSLLLPYICHQEDFVRDMACDALAKAMSIHVPSALNLVAETFKSIVITYKENLPIISNGKGLFNKQGELIETDSDQILLQKAAARQGCVAACGSLDSALNLSPELFADVFSFLTLQPPHDPNIQLMEVISSSTKIVDRNSKDHHSILLPLFESLLSSGKDPKVQEIVSLSLGTLALHVEGEKFTTIVHHLLKTLLSPQVSVAVQSSIATCISSISNKIKQSMDIVAIIRSLMAAVTGATSIERRGGAYGIAGFVSGLGLSSFTKYGIFEYIGIISCHKRSQLRHGALVCYEVLSKFLGRLFEPYLRAIIPRILSAYGDSSSEVRDAALMAAKSIMSNLTIYGVRLVMPPLLEASKNDAWRTKKESVQMLGSMAYISPRHLSTCLPEIVPCLVRVLSDSHYEVQEAARKALRDIGAVIGNPEILSIVPAIIKALEDPAESTGAALECLEKTAFVHRIDPPSLSLIVPITERGLKDRSTETKKKAASIIGNMCMLADPVDIRPYMNFLMPAIKGIIIDEIPQIRAMAARALANLIGGLGGDQFEELLIWLQATMVSNTGSVERAGAAQALADVYSVLDISKFEEYMEKLLEPKMHGSRDPCMREGVINIFRFFPVSMREKFELYLVRVLPVVLRGLSDESEFVRDSSNRAGNTIVNQYYNTSVKLLLPALENGLVDDNFRIQESSMELLETLLVKIVLGDSTVGAATIKDPDKILFREVGFEAAANVIATLYIVRFDSNITVTQKSVSVWKIIVTNPPKMLVDILRVLLKKVVSFLCTDSLHLQEISKKALADLVERLEIKVISGFLPLVSESLSHYDPVKRCGALMGLTEVISSAERLCIQGSFVTETVPSVRKGLCDKDENVRAIAGEAFGALYRSAGTRAMGDIIQPLINDLHGPGAAESLDALCQIVRVRGKVVLPMLLPTLYKTPVLLANAQALSKIASFAESSLPFVIGESISKLISSLVFTQGPVKEVLRVAAGDLCKYSGKEGSPRIISSLFALLKSAEPKPQATLEVCSLISDYCNGNAEFVEEACAETVTVSSFMDSLLGLFCDPRTEVQSAAWGALDSFIKTLDKANSHQYLEHLQKTIEHLPDKIRSEPGAPIIIPGFTLPKGIAPLLPLYSNAVGSGTPEAREIGALGIRDLFAFSTSEALGAYVIIATGPLIRVMGDRFPAKVKSAFLEALSAIMEKGKEKLKPLVPQLQTTLIKALKNPEKLVRVSAGPCLVRLLPLGVKAELVINDLVSGIATPESGVPESMLDSLKKVFVAKSANIGANDIAKTVAVAIEQMNNLSAETDHSTRFAASQLLATITSRVPSTESANIIVKSGVFGTSPVSEIKRVRQILAIALAECNQDLYNTIFATMIMPAILEDMNDSESSTREDVANSIGSAFTALYDVYSSTEKLIKSISSLVVDSSSDVCIAALNALKVLAKKDSEVVKKYASLILPVVVSKLQKCSQPVKHAGDFALFYSLSSYDGRADQTINSLGLDAATTKMLLEYQSKVLYRISPDEE